MNREEVLKKLSQLRKEGFLNIPNDELIKTEEQIQGIRESAKINTAVLDYVAERIKAGITTEQINDWVKEYTESQGAVCAPYKYGGFPKHVCVSIDDVVCHGIPNKNTVLKEGMIVNVDVSTIYKGIILMLVECLSLEKQLRKKKNLSEYAKSVWK